jgi:hypothetical protein
MAFFDTIKNAFTSSVGFNTGFGNFNPFKTTPQQPTNRTTFQPEPAPQISEDTQNILREAEQAPKFNIQRQTPTTFEDVTSTIEQQDIGVQPRVADSSLFDSTSTTGAYMGPGIEDRGIAGDANLSAIASLIGLQGEEGGFRSGLEEESGREEVAQLQKSLSDRFQRVQRAYDIEERDLRRESQGKTKGFLNLEISDVRRKRDEQLADLSLQYSAATGDLTAIDEAINKKVEAKFGGIQDQIKNMVSLYQLYQDDLSESEKILLENQISQKSGAYKNQVEQAQKQESAKVWEQMITSGKQSWKDVPNELIPFMNPNAQKAYTEEEILPIKQKFDTVTDLITGGAISGTVGPAWFTRLSPLSAFTGEKQNFIAGVEQLVSQETMKTLTDLKSKGGTLGALSDQERIMLQNAATQIGSWKVEKDGRVTGYNTTEKAFKKELNNFLEAAGSALLRADGVPIETKKEVLMTKTILNYPNASDQDIADIVEQTLPSYTQSFSSVGNTSASNIANAIKTVESGGNYTAKGGSGEFGAYQFMPNTWKQWASEFLGDPNAKPTRQNQDFVAQSKINQLINQGHGPEEIALIWNAGSPVRRKGVNRFGVRYDSGAYADKVIRQLNV